jgi:hypothetical protein
VPAELVAQGGKHLVGDILAPREAKRWVSAALRTGSGTPSSVGACRLQRPSPESETRPLKPSSRRVLSEVELQGDGFLLAFAR